jgi:hypothetical protein
LLAIGEADKIRSRAVGQTGGQQIKGERRGDRRGKPTIIIAVQWTQERESEREQSEAPPCSEIAKISQLTS